MSDTSIGEGVAKDAREQVLIWRSVDEVAGWSKNRCDLRGRQEPTPRPKKASLIPARSRIVSLK